jgi:predicted small metal-binding protein
MGKVLKCGDVVPRCKEEIKGDSEHDVLRKAAEHAKTVHNMESIPPDVLSKVKVRSTIRVKREHRKQGHRTRARTEGELRGGSERVALLSNPA